MLPFVLLLSIGNMDDMTKWMWFMKRGGRGILGTVRQESETGRQGDIGRNFVKYCGNKIDTQIMDCYIY